MPDFDQIEIGWWNMAQRWLTVDTDTAAQTSQMFYVTLNTLLIKIYIQRQSRNTVNFKAITLKLNRRHCFKPFAFHHFRHLSAAHSFDRPYNVPSSLCVSQ